MNNITHRRRLRVSVWVAIVVAVSLVAPGSGAYGAVETDFSSAAAIDVTGGRKIAQHGALLELPAGTKPDVPIEVTPLAEADVAPLDGGMVNVTGIARGYRFEPDGTRFSRSGLLTLPYDPALLPSGSTPSDIRTYFFDVETRRWVPLERVKADESRSVVVSATDHFTDFINATLTLPDHASPANLDPNAMTKVQPADAAAGIRMIAPPKGDATGDARLSFPIEVPPGRLGMQPRLEMTYSSAAANGWLGWGWNLAPSTIEVDTRFGVPRYDAGLETESYLIDGAQLAPVANRLAPVARVAERAFARRVEGSFDRIVRHGSSPDSYWWEVTDQRGVRSQYGRTASARLSSYGSPAPVFRWLLERTVDTHGNTVEYRYAHDDLTGSGEPSVAVYLSGIDYTGTDGGAPGRYHVDFVRDDGSRPDAILTGRPGFKVLTRFRLARIDVRLDSSVVRRYVLRYRVGEFSKSLLEAVGVQDVSGTELYRHTFDYYGMERNEDGSVKGFAAEERWNGLSSDDTAALLKNKSQHFSLFVGVGPGGSGDPHVGATPGWGRGSTETKLELLDVNGDGLPDRLRDSGALELNGLDASHAAGGFSQTTFPGTSTLAADKRETLSIAAGLHGPGENARVDANYSWVHADQTRRATDINGDGRPDLVSADSGFSVRPNDGHQFAAPGAYGGYDLSGVPLTDGEEAGEVQRDFRAADPLVRWVAPYTGNVSVSGAVKKLEAGGDGLRAFIYENETERWTGSIGAATGSTADPGTLNLHVSGGERLYFRVTSGDDTVGDRVSWRPRIEYTSICFGSFFCSSVGSSEASAAREPFGPRVYVFDHGADFRLAGPPSRPWAATADGKVDITGTIDKQTTTDTVTVAIEHNGTPLSTQLFSADAVTTDSISIPDVDVSTNDEIRFVVTASTPIDPARFVVSPTVRYTEYCRPDGACGTPSCGSEGCTIPGDGDADPLVPASEIEQQPSAEFPVHALRPHAPSQAWVAPADDTVDVVGAISKESTDGPVIALIQGRHRRYRKITLGPAAQTIPVPFNANDIDVDEGDRLFFTLYFAAHETANIFTSVDWSPSVDGDGAPVNRRRFLEHDSSDQFSGGFHRFATGEWNGNKPFEEASFAAPPDDDTPNTDFTGMTPTRDGVLGVAGPLWAGPSRETFIGPTQMRASRIGSNPMDVVRGGGLDTLQHTVARNATIGGSVFGQGASYNEGSSRTRLDLLDMNGDRFPDQVAPGQVRYNNGANAFGPAEPVDTGAGTVRKIENSNLGYTFGLGPIVNEVTSDGFTRALTAFLPATGTAYGTSNAVEELMDVNGDGLPDRVAMNPGDDTMSVRINLGYRFGAAEPWPVPDSGLDELACDDKLLTQFGSAAEPQTLRLNESASNLTDNTSASRTLAAFVDVNGDGLADRVIKRSEENAFRVALNRGTSFEPERLWSVPGWSAGVHPDTEGLFCGNDAIEASIAHNGGLNLGHEFKIPLSPAGPTLVIGPNANIGRGTTGAELVFTDIDGDGTPDHVLKRDDEATVFVKRNQVGKANLLRSVGRPLGGSFSIDYARQGNKVDDSDPARKVDMPTNHWVASKVVTSDGRGNTYKTSYEYFDSGFFDRAEREDYGFAHVREVRPDGARTDTYFHNQDLHRKMLPAKIVTYDADGKLLRRETNRYDVRAAGDGAFFPAPVEHATFFYEGATADESAFGVSTIERRDFDGRGNPVSFEQAGDAGAADDVRGTIEYHHDPTTYVTAPSRVRATNAGGDLLRETIGTYDAAGNLVRMERVLLGGKDPATGAPYTGSSNPVSVMSYDGAGNLASFDDPRGYRLEYAYDPDVRTHVTQTRDSFGYVSSASYDLRFGRRTTQTDANGQVSRYTYDTFGRLADVSGPYDTAGGPALSFEYQAAASPPFAVTRQKDVTRADPIDTVVFIDGLGREIQRKTDTELDSGSIGTSVSGRLSFDEKGRIAEEGQPVFSTEAGFVNVPMRNPTKYGYDALDRLVRVTLPDGSATSTAYGFAELGGANRLSMVQTDAEGRNKRVFRSVRNEILGVAEEQSVLTRYDYTPLSELHRVTDTAGNVTRYEYDSLGRRTSHESPDTGLVEYSYDLSGNLARKQTANLRAKGAAVRYGYVFNRLETVDYPEGADVRYSYGGPGAPDNTAARIVSVADESGTEVRSYGRLGEIVKTVRTMTSHTQTQGGETYTSTFAYDSFNRLLSMTYPDNEVLTYAYDAGGRVQKARGTKDGVAYDYVLRLGYDEFGDRVRLAAGNGAVSDYSYDPLTRRQTGLDTTAGGRQIQALRYTFDRVGNVLSRSTDQPAATPSLMGGPVSETFTYDSLDRLVSARGRYQFAPDKTRRYALDMTYDQLGNIRRKTQTDEIVEPGGSVVAQQPTTYDYVYDYGSSRPHAATHIGQRTYHFDEDGNETGWDDDRNGQRRRVAWTPDDRMREVSDDGQKTRFLYDASGTRSHKVHKQGETHYVNKYFTIRNRETFTKHVYAGGMRIAAQVGRPAQGSGGGTRPLHTVAETRYFYHPDPVGSTAYVTDDHARVFEHLQYFPFGETWVRESSDTTKTPYGFAGKELDEETGLYQFPARAYEPRLSRFTSADSLPQRHADTGSPAVNQPQWLEFSSNWNLYGYARNSPVTYVDPSGHFSFGAFGKGAGQKVLVAGALAATEAYLGEKIGKDRAALVVGGLKVGYLAYQAYSSGQKFIDEGKGELEAYALGTLVAVGDNFSAIAATVLEKMGDQSPFGASTETVARAIEFVPSLTTLYELGTGKDLFTGEALNDEQLSNRAGQVAGHIAGVVAKDTGVTDATAGRLGRWLGQKL